MSSPDAEAQPLDGSADEDASILRSSAVMAVGTLLSRATGYLRSILLAAAIGLALRADLFTVANTIPNAMYILVAGGLLNAVLVPQLVRAMRNDPDRGEAYASRVVSVVAIGLIVVTVVAVVIAPWLLRLYAPADLFTPELAAQRASMEAFARLCLPQIFFYGLYVLLGQILNARGSFGPMMFTPIANNVIACATIGVYLVVFGAQGGDAAFTAGEQWLLGVGSTLGIAAQALLLIPTLRRTGFRFRVRLDLRDSGLAHTMRLATWTVLFVVVNQIAYLVITRLAVGFSTSTALEGAPAAGGATVYQAAFLAVMVPHGLITVSLVTAALPKFSRLAAADRLPQLRREIVDTMRFAVAGAALAGVLLLAEAVPLAHVMFGWGAAADSTRAVAYTIMAFVPGLIAFTIHFIALRGFYALEDTRTPFLVQCTLAGTNVVLALALAAALGSASATILAVVYSVANTVGALVSTTVLARRLGGLHRVEFGLYLLRTGITALAAGACAAIVTFLALGVLPDDSVLSSAVAVILGTAVAVPVYAFIARLLGLPEVRRVGALLRSAMGRFGRTRGASPPRDAVPSSMGPAHGTGDSDPHGGGPTDAGDVDDTATTAIVDETTADGAPPAVEVGLDELLAGPAAERRGDPMPTSAEPGMLLGGRYRLDERLAGSGGAETWRGVDEVLNRPVALHLLPADDPRVPELAVAAREAAGIPDPHFLRMLDVDEEAGRIYVVREWVPGHNLGEVLAAGPLDADDAAYVARELAQAMTASHDRGIAHLRLEPDTVVLADSGQVKVVDLGVDRVLYGTQSADPARTDAEGIARVLYACLTGRWPDGPALGLPAAPVQDDRLCSPRQVLAGVPSGLDEVCDRALADPPRGGRSPLRTPEQVWYAIEDAASSSRRRPVAAADTTSATGMHSAPIAVTPATTGVVQEPVPAPVAAQPDPAWHRPDQPPATIPPPPRRGGVGSKILGTVVAVVLLGGALLLGYQLALQAFGTEEQPTPSAGPTGTSTVPTETTPAFTPVEIPIAAATTYDLVSTGGSGDENDGLIGRAIDGDPSTAWTTENYSSPMSALDKQGVGIVLDLGGDHTVSAVQLALLTSGGTLDLRVAPEGSTAIPDSIDQWRIVATASNAAQQITLNPTLTDDPEAPVVTRYVLVWFTELPPYEGVLKDGVAEAVVLGE